MLIRIYDIGRSKASTSIEVTDPLDADGVSESIFRAVIKMKALMSRDVQCTWDSITHRGVIYAGGRPVGYAEGS